MLNRYARALFTRMFTPVARGLLSLGLTPNMVTVIGAAGVGLGALIFYPLGELFWGTVVITLFIFSDLVDGVMARLSGKTGAWGSFLDSTLDRVQDAAVFIGLILWYFTAGANTFIAVTAAICLVTAMLVSYVRSKAESLGLRADVGVAERAERMVATLVFTGLTGLGLDERVLAAVLVLLAAASLYTIGQRMLTVHRQTQSATDDASSTSEA